MGLAGTPPFLRNLFNITFIYSLCLLYQTLFYGESELLLKVGNFAGRCPGPVSS